MFRHVPRSLRFVRSFRSGRRTDFPSGRPQPLKHALESAQAESKAPASDLSSAPLVSLEMKLPESSGGGSIALDARVGETLLDTALRNNLNVDGTCAGDLACSTCHCVLGSAKIYDAAAKLNEKTALEDDLLSSAWDVRSTSRLSCQVEVTEEMEGMTIEFPSMINGYIAPERKARRISKQDPGAMFEPIPKKKFRNITKSAIPEIFRSNAGSNPELLERLEEFSTMAAILPFRTNNYVIEELIDWSNVPNDPMFQLTFPQPGMLAEQSAEVERVAKIRQERGSAKAIREAAREVRASLNPHPAKQREMNVPNHQDEDKQIEFEQGMQHKYRETVLFFPSEAQYCHSYCTYCFRWAQFVGEANNQFASNEAEKLVEYLKQNKGVTDILFTGGDPMVLNSGQLSKYLDTIATEPGLEHVQTIRIGSKSLAYWPYKYVTDDDADDLMRLFERVVASGKHVSLMAHFTHPVELSTPVVREAIRRIRNTGVQIRCQAPLTDHINNDPDIWAEMWREQVKLGMVPYYMFVERDTGAKNWFGLPLARALEVYNGATQQLSGLARTARGPSMSCTPGKVHVLGVEEIAGEKVFVLKFLQARNPEWTGRVFFAKYDEKAAWMDDLRPAFGEDRFFFEPELDDMEVAALKGSGSSGQLFQPSIEHQPTLEI